MGQKENNELCREWRYVGLKTCRAVITALHIRQLISTSGGNLTSLAPPRYIEELEPVARCPDYSRTMPNEILVVVATSHFPTMYILLVVISFPGFRDTNIPVTLP